MARLILLPVFLMCLIHCTFAYDFYVGVRSGWVVKPAENYNSWAGRMRFQVKDKLIFNYKEGADSVLVVTKEDYDSCNTKNPIKRFEDGKTVFVFDRSGPFFFISGADGHCSQGQKLIVVVMGVRNKHVQPPPKSISPSISPSPSASITPPSSSPSFAPDSKSPSPSATITPSSSPSFAPDSNSPSSSPISSPSPSATITPSSSPSFAPDSKSPSKSPISSPSPSPSSSKTPTLSPVPSPAKSSPPSPSSISPASGGGGGGSGGVAPPAISPSSNSTSTPTSSAQIITVSRLSYGIFTLFLGATLLL